MGRYTAVVPFDRSSDAGEEGGSNSNNNSSNFQLVISKRACSCVSFVVLIAMTCAALFVVDWELTQDKVIRGFDTFRSKLPGKWGRKNGDKGDQDILAAAALAQQQQGAQQYEDYAASPAFQRELEQFYSQPVQDGDPRILWRMEKETPQDYAEINDTLRRAIRRYSVSGIWSSKSVSYVFTVPGYYAGRSQVLNMLCNLNRLGIRNPVVLCLDKELQQFLNDTSPDILTVHFQSPDGVSEELEKLRKKPVPSAQAPNLFSTQYAELTFLRIYAVYRLLKLGHHVVFAEPDAVLCQDAAEEAVRAAESLVSHAKSDIVFLSDWPANVISPGFFFARPNWRSMYFLESVLVADKALNIDTDQVNINRILCEGQYGGRREQNGCSRGSFRATVFPTEAFSNGAFEAALQGKKSMRLWYYPKETVMNSCSLGNDDNRMVLLNNHIWPDRKKKDRLVVKGFWYLKNEYEWTQQAATSESNGEQISNASTTDEHIPGHRLPDNPSNVQYGYLSASSYTSIFCLPTPMESNQDDFSRCSLDCGDSP